jgi:hypothetical protein
MEMPLITDMDDDGEPNLVATRWTKRDFVR